MSEVLTRAPVSNENAPPFPPLDVFVPGALTAFIQAVEHEGDERPDYLIAAPERVRVASKATYDAVRREMRSKKLRGRFFALCAGPVLDALPSGSRDVARAILKTFQFHHILPKAFGGMNPPENIALVAPSLHLMIHRYLDRQPRPLDGWFGTLWIPRHEEGARVWGLRTTILALPHDPTCRPAPFLLDRLAT